MKPAPFFALLVFCAFILLPVRDLQAASLFEKYKLEGHSGPYLVKKKNVNVRQKPSNKGKRLTKLKRREIIDVIGLAKGTQWAAIKKDGDELGFVYVFSITPIIDASFNKPLEGRVDMTEDGKPDCDFRLTFEGRFEEEDVVFVSSDYLVGFNCRKDAKDFSFTAMMFMSEVPHDLGTKPVYQITMNLPEVATGYEEFLSATTLYNQKEEKVIMDAVSLKQFKEKVLRKHLPATTTQEAVLNSIELQLQSFNEKAWKTIAGEIPSPGIKEPD